MSGGVFASPGWRGRSVALAVSGTAALRHRLRLVARHRGHRL
jgi:hypothetical protein